MRGLLRDVGLMFDDPADEAAFVERYVLRNLVATQLLMVAAGIIFYVFFLWDRIIDPVHWPTAHFIRGVIGTPALWVLAFLAGLRPFRPYLEYILSFGVMVGGVGLAVIYYWLDGGYDYGSVGFVLVILVGVSLFPMRLTFLLAALLVTVGAAALGEAMSPTTQPGMWIVNGLCLGTAVTVGLMSAVRRELAARSEMRLTREVEAGRARIEELLHSMLPSEIVARIQGGETAIADAYGEVTIVFADLVGFTEMSRRLAPAHLVEVLNRFFSDFDQRAEAHGLERIKTIGDAYMAVGGLNRADGRTDHARAAALFALEVQGVVSQFSQELGYPIKARVGLHIGPVVAGVIGTKRPAFDCWGESVNLASRLEGVADPGSIIISESAYWRLKAHFPISVLDDVDLKGIGPTRVYLLGRPAEAPPATVGAAIGS